MRTYLGNLKGQWNLLALALGVSLAFSLAFGGASRLHELRVALVQLASLPILVLALSSMLRRGAWRDHRFALGLLGAVALLPLAQLIPLPPALWTNLPGREELVLALELAGIQPGWTPLSLTPDKTWRSWLSLIPPAGVFLAMLCIGEDLRRGLIGGLLAACALMILLGTAQIVTGDALYPWETTDAGNVVGLFANRNHFATFCLVCVPFAAVLAGTAARRGAGRGGMTLWLASLLLLLIVVAIAAGRSRAGVVLFVPALALSLLAAWSAAGRSRPRVLFTGLGVGAAIGVAAVAYFALGPVLARFDTAGVREGRYENWPYVLQAADRYLPLGSGLGSFDPVYRSVEPLSLLDATFFNQAHNEYLEIWLETGWLGAVLLVLFGVWFFRRARIAWLGQPRQEQDLQRAASIGIGVCMLHSVVDYPLRTLTMASVFALLCGVLEMAGRTRLREQRRSRSS